ncbi:MAG: SMP-30/gluconolactonase/LRE family protein [Bauldia sp.]
MKRIIATGLVALAASTAVAYAQAPGGGNNPPPPPRPYFLGNPIGVPAAPPAPDAQNPAPFVPMSDNVLVYGAFRSAEACQYDPGMDLVVVTNMGIAQNLTPNDGYLTLLNHDGTVHTPKWVGVQAANQRGEANLITPLVLNQPFGIDIVNGVIYIADSDGNLANPDPAATGNTPTVFNVRTFDAATGEPIATFPIPEAGGLINDVAVAADGTIYASQTSANENARIWKIAPDGTVSVFFAGAPLNSPNGVAMDPDGNIVVVNIGDNAVLTFSPDGTLVNTEQAAQAGNDGLVVLADGTKYISSVREGGVSMIPAGGGEATLIATGIPSAASMCYDPTANALFIPMNNNNAVARIQLD